MDNKCRGCEYYDECEVKDSPNELEQLKEIIRMAKAQKETSFKDTWDLYDRKIAPLQDQINEICGEEGIPFLTAYQLSNRNVKFEDDIYLHENLTENIAKINEDLYSAFTLIATGSLPIPIILKLPLEKPAEEVLHRNPLMKRAFEHSETILKEIKKNPSSVVSILDFIFGSENKGSK